MKFMIALDFARGPVRSQDGGMLLLRGVVEQPPNRPHRGAIAIVFAKELSVRTLSEFSCPLFLP
jgi:hypothetical protein